MAQLKFSRFNPFDLASDDDYRRWRDAKLAQAPARVGDLIVEIASPDALSGSEKEALSDRLCRCNMAVYVLPRGQDPGKAFMRRLGRAFGLERLDANPYSDDDAITSLAVKSPDRGAVYIPYTNRPIHWHTDGYYNRPDQQISGLILHCAHAASEGGVNRIMDPELVYIALREANPAHIKVLMAANAMTIPANDVNDFVSRESRSGPVFSVAADGSLHMRYTARKRHVIWDDAPALQAALAALRVILDAPEQGFTHKLAAGQGLICNNVLHDRSGFTNGNDAPPRLLYRARYFDRVSGTCPDDLMARQQPAGEHLLNNGRSHDRWN